MSCDLGTTPPMVFAALSESLRNVHGLSLDGVPFSSAALRPSVQLGIGSPQWGRSWSTLANAGRTGAPTIVTCIATRCRTGARRRSGGSHRSTGTSCTSKRLPISLSSADCSARATGTMSR